MRSSHANLRLSFSVLNSGVKTRPSIRAGLLIGDAQAGRHTPPFLFFFVAVNKLRPVLNTLEQQALPVFATQDTPHVHLLIGIAVLFGILQVADFQIRPDHLADTTPCFLFCTSRRVILSTTASSRRTASK